MLADKGQHVEHLGLVDGHLQVADRLRRVDSLEMLPEGVHRLFHRVLLPREDDDDAALARQLFDGLAVVLLLLALRQEACNVFFETDAEGQGQHNGQQEGQSPTRPPAVGGKECVYAEKYLDHLFSNFSIF